MVLPPASLRGYTVEALTVGGDHSETYKRAGRRPLAKGERLGMRFLTAFLLLFALVANSGRPAGAGTLESHIYTKNDTNVWVWVTAYQVYGPGVSKIMGAWCVGPQSFDHHGLHANIREVRFEITKNHGCAHPVLLDKTEFGPSDRATATSNTYTIRHEGSGFQILGGRDRY